MLSIIKKKLKIKKFYQTELLGIIRKCKRHTVRLCYLKSKNCEQRKNWNLSKLYITLQNRWYFQKKNNLKLSKEWFYIDNQWVVEKENFQYLTSKILEEELIDFIKKIF